jgi:ribosomal protein S18 acetylase RimI-like enzyme
MTFPQAEHIRSILEQDRTWSAYALADLDPPYAEFSEWIASESAVALIYHGLQPSLLFAAGVPRELSGLFDAVPAGQYQYALLPAQCARLASRITPESETRMWRMIFSRQAPPAPGSDGIRRLDAGDLPVIEQLYAGHADQPDSFLPAQLEQGPFFGAFQEGTLIATSGVHIYSERSSIAAIGNVFTSPPFRGQGLGTRVTGHVVNDLLMHGIKTIVLNVAQENRSAIASYTKIGFTICMGFLEGKGYLA